MTQYEIKALPNYLQAYIYNQESLDSNKRAVYKSRIKKWLIKLGKILVDIMKTGIFKDQITTIAEMLTTTDYELEKAKVYDEEIEALRVENAKLKARFETPFYYDDLFIKVLAGEENQKLVEFVSQQAPHIKRGKISLELLWKYRKMNMRLGADYSTKIQDKVPSTHTTIRHRFHQLLIEYHKVEDKYDRTQDQKYDYELRVINHKLSEIRDLADKLGIKL